ncbi:TrkH family potassium uptake protein [Wenxinia marina]|uniref:Potassium uptake protein, TrkH family n=1 Tax=Wenxinia marina DSM 24838 TaxID=1123501 RepID=A0A0D0NJ76_9RHOB|nr:TrkH family potassium uptake protein [Wenxinia marina]KIQ68400.1 potassium uptake protein, TrkH family [Wenxinia marina DSM 24838]GGL72501.1 Ktr system potassium transporter B [Wenxinia marina]
MGRAASRRSMRRLPPPALLALMYLTVIAMGTVLLSLPVAQEVPVSLLTAFFTSTSAVTVTGLVTVDPASTFTLFGEIVIAVLIQIGGLGLMTFAAFLLLTLGISIGMPQRVILSEELGSASLEGLMRLAKLILTVALVAEAAGTAILATEFVPDHGWAHGLWLSLFHTISAFNNAGFALFPDSLMGYNTHPVVSLSIAAMFILGGLGFVVLGDIAQARSWLRLSLHSKLMLVGTAFLLILGFVLIALLEWSNPLTLGGLSPADRLVAAFFQSATTRTAGFNSIDIGAMGNASTVLMMVLMFIGGGSTSTAGGIKVTTAIVLLLATRAFFRQRQEFAIFGRSLGLVEVMKVMALTTVSLGVVALSIFLIAIHWQGSMFDLTFEVVSAFGTVGLSRGATYDLTAPGQILICFVMFVGRVGPLTLGFFLAMAAQPRVAYPKGQIYLG